MVLAALMYGGTCTLNLKAHGGLDLLTNHHQGWNPSSLASMGDLPAIHSNLYSTGGIAYVLYSRRCKQTCPLPQPNLHSSQRLDWM